MIKNLTINSEKGIKINKALIHNALNKLRTDLNITIQSLSIVFLYPEKTQEINREFLGHDYSTDIITFNYNGDNKDLDGEMFICISEAVDNSRRFRCSVDKELLRLVIHGILHLVGFDDKTEPDRKLMKKNENKYLKELEYLIKDKLLVYDSKNS
ncbi:MAG: rRNA maturation RNase YbeY [Bacillota bacterium]